jgi:hypothetical protein
MCNEMKRKAKGMFREYKEVEEELFEQDITKKRPLIKQMSNLGQKAENRLRR